MDLVFAPRPSMPSVKSRREIAVNSGESHGWCASFGYFGSFDYLYNRPLEERAYESTSEAEQKFGQCFKFHYHGRAYSKLDQLTPNPFYSNRLASK
jgi:hypothetical protein